MSLKLLPLMYIYEINDISFSSNPISHPLHISTSIIMLPFLITQPDLPSIPSFCTLTNLLIATFRHFYFYRLPRLWNALPYIRPVATG